MRYILESLRDVFARIHSPLYKQQRLTQFDCMREGVWASELYFSISVIELRRLLRVCMEVMRLMEL